LQPHRGGDGGQLPHQRHARAGWRALELRHHLRRGRLRGHEEGRVGDAGRRLEGVRQCRSSAERGAQRLPGGRRGDGKLQPCRGRDRGQLHDQCYAVAGWRALELRHHLQHGRLRHHQEDRVGDARRRPAGGTVGSYPISATLAPAGVLSNYDSTYNTAGFDITKKPASVTPAAGQHKTYGGADPALSGATSGFLAADGVTASYNRTAGETVGSYPSSAPLAPAGVLSNYDITYNTAIFAITKKAASVTPAAASKVYGSVDPALSGALGGFLVADGV